MLHGQDTRPQHSSPSYLDVDATKPLAQSGGGGISEERRDGINDFFRYPERPFAAHSPSHLSQNPHSPLPRRSSDVPIPSHNRLPARESIPLQERLKRSFSTGHTAPPPVTGFPNRPRRKLYWTATRPVLRDDISPEEQNENINARRVTVLSAKPETIAKGENDAHIDQSSSEATRSYSTAQPQMPQHPESQPATQPVQEGEYYDTIGEDPYEHFFQPSQSSLPLASSDPSPMRRLWDVFFVPPVLRLKRRFFAQRALFTNSPLQGIENSKPTEPTQEGKPRAGDEDEEHVNDVDLPDSCAILTPGAAERNNREGKQPEESQVITDTPPLYDASSFADIDSNENRTLRKSLMRNRGKDTTPGKKAPAKMTYDTSPEVVEVCTARGFKRLVVHRRKHKKKLRVLTTVAPTTTVHARSSSQVHTGPSSQSIGRREGRRSQPTGGLVSHSSQGSPPHHITTYDNDDDSDSGSIMQGSWNKFLDKICFPCGHYYEDT